jgi:hypothetical protein
MPPDRPDPATNPTIGLRLATTDHPPAPASVHPPRTDLSGASAHPFPSPLLNARQRIGS